MCFLDEVVCTRFAHAIERNHSRNFLASENWVNKFVFINHFVIILRVLSTSSNWRKSYVSTTKSMLSRAWLCSRQKRTTCFINYLSHSHVHVKNETVSIWRWNRYFVKFMRSMRICVIKLLLILIKFSCNFKRFLKTRNDNVTQILRSSLVWYSLQAFFHFFCSHFLSFLSIDVFSLSVVSLIFAQRFLNQKCLRSFDVKSANRHRRLLDCVSLRLILLQWSMINVL